MSTEAGANNDNVFIHQIYHFRIVFLSGILSTAFYIFQPLDLWVVPLHNALVDSFLQR